MARLAITWKCALCCATDGRDHVNDGGAGSEQAYGVVRGASPEQSKGDPPANC